MPYKEGARWRGKVTHQGQRYTALKPSKKDAIAWENEKRKELKQNEKRLQLGLDLLTFCSKYQIYAERFAPKTYQEKKALGERIIKAWGSDFLVHNITPEIIQTFLDDQAAFRSANASNRDRKNLMAMWCYGRRILNIQSNPLAEIRKRSHTRNPQYVPPVEDILKVIVAATRPERLFLECYLQTGARRTEVFRWTWIEDINFEHRKVRLGSRKSRDGSMMYRWIDMSNDLYENLKWLWENREFKRSPYVWINDHPGPHYGKPYVYRRRFLAGLCKRAKVKKFGFHALRRFVASILQDSGKVSLKKIQLLLGHSNLATTERYIYHLGEDLKSTVSVISETLTLKTSEKKESDNAV